MLAGGTTTRKPVYQILLVSAVLLLVIHGIRTEHNRRTQRLVTAERRQKVAAVLTDQWRPLPKFEANFVKWADSKGIRTRVIKAADAREDEDGALPDTFETFRESGTELDAHLSEASSWQGDAIFRSLSQSRYYHKLAASDPRIRAVCESGFHGGHSAVNWLMANRKLKVYSFDAGEQSYVRSAQQWVSSKFGKRLTLALGDPAIEIPHFAETRPDVKCQLIHVNGGGSYEAALRDITALAPLADPAFHVLLVNDVGCDWDSQCGGPTRAVEEGVESNAIQVDEYTQAEVAREEAGSYPKNLKPIRGYVRGMYVQR